MQHRARTWDQGGRGRGARSGAVVARAAVLVGLAGLAALTACEPLEPVNTGGETTIEVRLTASAAKLLRAAEIDIGAIHLVGQGPDSTVTSLTSDATGGFVDLTRIVPTARPQLARAGVESGRYVQLRVALLATRVELALGYGFADGTTQQEVDPPTGAQPSIRLNLDLAGQLDDDSVGIKLLPGLTTLMLDFDAAQSFVFWQRPGVETTIDSVTLTPAFRVVMASEAGSISGTVNAVSGGTNAGLPVVARAIDPSLLGPYQIRSGSAVTDNSGAYTVDFLPAGQYAVSVTPEDGETAEPVATGVTLGEGQEQSGVDFTVTGGG